MLVDTGCGRLFVDVSGTEGPDVVLWPSLLTDGGLWHYQLPRLDGRYRIFSIDPPGHGRSDPTRRAYSLDDCVRAAVSVLDTAGAKKPAWCGLSWGGMVGMRLAARDPDRLSCLVLADTSARTSTPWQRIRFGALGAIARRVGPIGLLVKQVVPEMFAHPSEHRDDVRRFVVHAKGMDRRSIGHSVDAVLLNRRDATEEISRITVPTLVLVGEEDRPLPGAEAEHLAQTIPRAELVTLPGAGHLSCLEAPERFTAELMRFLAERHTSTQRAASNPESTPTTLAPTSSTA